MAKRHVIVGGGTAGWNAITTIREIDKGDSEIVLVSDENPYARMVLPYYLSQEIGESHVFTATETRLEKLTVETHLGRRATSLNPDNNRLILDNGDEIDYDNLLIATGSSPVRAPVPGADGDGVHSFWTIDQAREVTAGLKPGARVAMIGAGFISFTILNALIKRGVELTIIEIAPRILPRMLDDEGAVIVQGWLEERGIKIMAGVEVTSIEDASGGGKIVKLKSGTDVNADLVIMATGIKTNLEWLEGSGIEVNHGVVVNDHLRSSESNVYAAGDVAEGPDLLSEGKVVHAIEPTAMQHGRVVGANMAGVDTAFEGSLLMNIVDVLDLEIASFGRWDDEKLEVVRVVQAGRPAYRKLLFEEGRLVGAIVLGRTRDIWATNDVGMIKGLVQSKCELSEWKAHLKKNPFDIKCAYLAAGAAGNLIPQTLLGRPSV
jgi:NAD(P)H-nitrite reductase large subunit